MSTTTHKPSLPAELRQGGSMRARNWSRPYPSGTPTPLSASSSARVH